MWQPFFSICLFVYLLPLKVLSLPSAVLVLPNHLTNTSMLNTTVTKPKPKPKPEPDPPFHTLTCLNKPSFYFIDAQICRPIFDSLLNAPSARDAKVYTMGTKEFGWSPCHITLKKSHGPMALEITVVELVNTAKATIDYCKDHQGAGWAQFQEEVPWYLLVHGDPYSKYLAAHNGAVISTQSAETA